jgi:hypothetical protein
VSGNDGGSDDRTGAIVLETRRAFGEIVTPPGEMARLVDGLDRLVEYFHPEMGMIS